MMSRELSKDRVESLAVKGIDPDLPQIVVHIVTLFPELFECWLRQGVVSRSIERGIVTVRLENLRDFGIGRHQVTDDYPFGGGPGMVLKPEPLDRAISSVEHASGCHIVLLSPHGSPFDHAVAERLAKHDRLILVAGHYEGVDERVKRHLIDEEISIGDYVLSCGELAAMVVVDAVVRLLPGVLAEGSASNESFSNGLLEYPQYTRPAEYRGWSVPDVLLSGNHGEIARWRRHASLRSTYERRPDLLERADLSAGERELVTAWRKGNEGHGNDAG